VPKGAPKRALKLGIDKDILARCPDLSRELLTAMLRDYTSGRRYRPALALGAVRVDLDGNPAGVVSTTHAVKQPLLKT
jgi:ProP effector